MGRYLEIPDQKMTQATPIRLLKGEGIGEGLDKDLKKSVKAFARWLTWKNRCYWISNAERRMSENIPNPTVLITSLGYKNAVNSISMPQLIIGVQALDKSQYQVNNMIK